MASAINRNIQGAVMVAKGLQLLGMTDEEYSLLMVYADVNDEDAVNRHMTTVAERIGAEVHARNVADGIDDSKYIGGEVM